MEELLIKLRRTKFIIRKGKRKIKSLLNEEKHLFIQLQRIGLEASRFCAENKDKNEQEEHIAGAKKKIKQTKILVAKTQNAIEIKKEEISLLELELSTLENIYLTMQEKQIYDPQEKDKHFKPPFVITTIVHGKRPR